MMTKRIFRSIFLVALAVFLAGTALTMGAVYRYYSDVYEGRIREEAAYPFGTLEEAERALRLTVHAQPVRRVEPRTRTVTTARGDTARYGTICRDMERYIV